MSPGAIARVPGLSVGDTQAGFLTVRVTDTNGTLVMQDANGQALLGSGTSSITLSGSAAIVNAELATLAYTAPATGGSDTIAVNVTDSAGATATDFIPVTTVALPAAAAPGGPLLSLPAALSVAARATVAIPDAVLIDLYYATHPGLLTLTVAAVTGTLRMTMNAVALAPASSLTIGGSEAAVAAALATLSYTASGMLGTDTLSISVTDAAGMTATASLPISVLHSLSVVGPSSFHAIAGAITSLGSLQIVDAATAGNAAQLKVTVSDTMGALAITGASGSPVAGSGTNTITITGTPDQVNAELTTLTYTPSGSLLTESMTIAVSGGGLSGSRAVPISVVPSVAISAPAASQVGNNVVAPIRGVVIADSYASGGTIQMRITVSDLYGALAMVNAAGAALPGSGTHTITLTGTLTTVNAELATLTYTGPSYPAGDTITIAATDADGGSATGTISVPVASGPALSTYFQVGDTAGHPFGRQPFLTSGGMILSSAATGLSAGVSEQVGAGGVVTLASLGWNVVNAVNVVDPSGGSYVLSNFVYVAATLSGGPTAAGQAETLTVNTALQGAITLGSGNQNVVINAGVGGAVPSGGSQFTIAGGSGTETLTVNGYNGLTRVNVTAGSGNETMTFINTGAVGVVGGAGNATIHGGNNGNSITAGTGTIDAWGGTGADAFTFHAGDGLMTIENFGANDVLFLDRSLQPWLVETAVSGGVALTFANNPAEEVVLKGLDTFPASRITWTGSAGANTPNAAGQYIAISAPATVASSTAVIVPVTGVAIGDAYAAANGLTMTVVVDDTSGLLAMVDGSGNPVAGSGGNEIVLTGSLATVNAELATLTYTGPSYATADAITIAAADTAGGASTQAIAVPVATAAALSTYFQVGDTAGHPFGRQPFLTSGGMILSSAATGLSAGVSEQVGAGGVVTLASLGWNVVNAVNVVDPSGGSYVLSNFVYVAATLSGGPTAAGQAETLTVDTALQGAITLGSGNQNVVINAGVGGAVPSGGSQFTIAGGSGTETLTVNGYNGLTQVNVTAGSGNETMTFINTGAVGVVGGAGNATIHGGNNGNSITAGTGMIDAWGGTGADAFTFHAGDGLMTIENFGANDVLFLDRSLQPWLVETAVSGGVALTFANNPAEEVVLKGLDAFPASRITWTGSAGANTPNAAGQYIAISAPATVASSTAVIVPVTGVAIGDAYAAANGLTMTVVVDDTSGLLAMVDGSGNPVAGSGGNEIVLTGSLATVNAELATLTYSGPSYATADAITIAAADTAGGASTQAIAVPVATAAALSTYFQVGDTAGHPFGRQPFLTSGGMILSSAATGLSAGVSEQVGAGGVVTLASLGWNVVNAVNMVDPSGGSYVLSNFVYVAATLSGGPTAAGQAETLTVDTALQGAITLGSGNQNVVINAGVGGAVPSGGSQFTIAGGSGTETLTVNGYNGLTRVNVTAGSGNETMTFINTGAVGVVGGAGNATIHGGNNGNSITAGTGTIDAWGGTGADAFTFHAGDGLMTIENFGANDVLFLDRSLQPWLVETAVSGGVALTFANNPAEEVVLKGLNTFPASRITWTGSAGANTPNAAGQYIAISAPATVASSTAVIVPVTGVAIGDAYAAANGLTMTVVVDDTSGLLAMVDGSGNPVAGSGGNEIVLTGSLATVNAELATLTYTGPSYATTDAITIAAADTAGGASTQAIAVPVATAAALSTYFQVGDTAGHPFGRQPFLTSGGMILSSAATGLSAGVSEQVGAGGVVTLASLGWNVVNAVNVVDPSGGSYVLSNFVYVAATLSGGPTAAGQAETLTVDTALQGAITLGSGNQNVVINAGVGGAVPSGGSQFTIAGGSGTETLTVNGYNGLTRVNVTAGSGNETMTFINTGAVGVVGGAGNATIYGGNNGNSITAGTGTIDAWGGTGADAFIFHAGDGLMTIENFAANDYLSIDQSLKASAIETVTGAGLLFQFGGSAAHEILVKGLSSLSSSQLGWN